MTCNYFPPGFNIDISAYAFANVSLASITWASAAIRLDFPWAYDVWLTTMSGSTGSISSGNDQYRLLSVSFLFCFHILQKLLSLSIGSLGGLSPSCLSNDLYPCIFPWNLRQTLPPLLMVLKCALLGALRMVFPPDSSCLWRLLREVVLILRE